MTRSVTRILHLEDRPEDAELVARALEKEEREYRIDHVTTREEFLARLEKEEADLVLLDYTVPGFDGLRALRASLEAMPETPVVMVTGSIDEETAVACLKAGASDYVLKDHLARLPSAVDLALAAARERAEKKAAQEALKESENRIRSLVETANDVILTLDEEGTVVFCNSAVRAAFGYEPDEVLGAPAFRLVPSRFWNEVRELFSQRMSDPDGPEFKRYRLLTLRRRDGSEFPVEMSASYEHTDDGILLNLILRDVSERHAARHALEELSREHELLLTSVAEGIVGLGPEGKITFANPAALDLLSAAAREVLGRDFHDLVHGSRGAGSLCSGECCPFLACMKARAEKRGESEFREMEGGTFPVAFSCTPLDETGEREGTVIFFQDITERREAEEALHRSEERHRSLFDSIRDAILVADTDRKIIGCNPAFEDLFGYEVEEIQGRETSCVYDEPDEFRAMGEELSRNLEDPNFLFTVNYRKKSGDVFPGETNVFHFENAEGELEGFIGLIRDVTERRNLEAQLRQAQKMEAVGQLTGGIAHDFNNELSVIQLNTELLRGALELEQTPDLADLEAVENATKRAARITRQLLGFSRRAELKLEDTDLATLVRDLRKLFQRIVTERIRLVMECQEDVPSVLVDPGSIEQVLMNVVNNARDAMPEGGRLSISVKEVELGEDYVAGHPYAEPGRYVRIAAEDTGTGMEPEVREKVFEPFFTTKPSESGTGLGLSMAYGLVKQQGGHLDIRSERGKGTTVAIFLPVLEAPVRKEPEVGRGVEDGKREEGGAETILVVEDEEPVLATARRALQRKGYAVLTARDGKAGLDLFREHAGDIDLVLTDLIMPEMGGSELIQAIREEHPEVKVILSSGYSGEASRERRRTSRATDVPFLRKPWSLADLLSQVRKVLDDDDGG